MKVEILISNLEKLLSSHIAASKEQNEMKARLAGGEPIVFNNKDYPKKGAVLILLTQEPDGRITFPLIQRPQYNGVHGGQISLPGGKMETTDANLIETAIRESEEEIGTQRKKIRILGELSTLFVAASNYEVLPVVGYSDHKQNFVAQESEVDEIIEVSLEELLNPERAKEKMINIRGRDLITPYYDLQKKFVWGATAMILSEFKSILNKSLKIKE